MRDRYDVVVVGGRVAGAATASQLARAGLDVLVAERNAPGSDTASTHALLGPASELLGRWGLRHRLVAAGTLEIAFDQSADLTNGRVALRLDAETGLTGVQTNVLTVIATGDGGSREAVAKVLVGVKDEVTLDVTGNRHLVNRRRKVGGRRDGDGETAIFRNTLLRT